MKTSGWESARSIALRWIAVNLACACWATTAGAHPEFSPTVTNRYVKLSLIGPNEVRLAYTVMYGAGPALAARQAADTNRDGTLDEAETRGLGARLRDEVARGLALTVDGKPARAAFEEPAVGLAGAEVGPSPFSVDLIARIAAPGGGPHELRFDDTTPVPELGETEVRLEEAPGTRLVAAHRGPDGVERETRFVFRGPKLTSLEDRSITLRFEGARASSPVANGGGGHVRQIAAAAGGALVLLLFGVFVYRKMNG